MLRKENRLTKKVDFKRVLKEGKMVQGRIFSLSFLKSSENFEPKFGIIVSNRVSKRSVVRNKIKRLLREALRLNLIGIPKGGMFVFLAKKNAVDASGKVVLEDLKTVFKKLGTLNG